MNISHTAIVKMIWSLSADCKNNSNIGVLLLQLSEKYGWDRDESFLLEQSLYEGLLELSTHYTIKSSVYGYCTIQGVDCYWWSDNAKFVWSSDMPDFWEEIIALHNKIEIMGDY